MITQLKNQDPFKPHRERRIPGPARAVRHRVRASQGCRRRSTRSSSSLVSNQALQASALVGRSALVETSTIGARQRAAPSRAPSICPRRASAVSVVTFATRRARRSARVQLGVAAAGLASFAWDGLADDGSAGSGRALHLRRRRICRAPSSVVADTLAARADRQRLARRRRFQRRAARHRRAAVHRSPRDSQRSSFGTGCCRRRHQLT